MKRFLVLIMASVFFASGMPPAESRAAEEYVLSLNLPIPPIHNRWHFALKQWTEELNKRSSGRIRVEPYFAEALSKEADAFESVKDGISTWPNSAMTRPWAVPLPRADLHPDPSEHVL